MTTPHPLDEDSTDQRLAKDVENWREFERRRPFSDRDRGWTMAREIIGTIIGMLAVMIPLGIVLIGWGSRVEANLTSHSLSIDYIHQEARRSDMRVSEAESKLDHRLERIETKVDRLVERK